MIMAFLREQESSLTNLPGLPPPPGITPNFVDPCSRVWLAVFVISITLTVTTLLDLVQT